MVVEGLIGDSFVGVGVAVDAAVRAGVVGYDVRALHAAYLLARGPALELGKQEQLQDDLPAGTQIR